MVAMKSSFIAVLSCIEVYRVACGSLCKYPTQATQAPKNTTKPDTFARLTYYTSYPECCDNSNTTDTTECDDYSGCKWKGQFACTGFKSKSWVKNSNIVAFYDDNDPNGKYFKPNYCNKQIRLTKDLKNGTTVSFVATVYDTCGNGDCSGCCKKNSYKGKLVDVESFTAKRHFGSLEEAGWGIIKYEFV